jgi:amino acid transporter
VFTISLGAMVGSGIFVLPGLGYFLAGPAVIVAYFLAGVVVLPAAFSKSEMATAMPHAGGTYLYIDRAMGPLMGTIAGFGVWFSLIFKAAFALVGLSVYLQLLIPDVPAKPVALVLGAGLVLVNVAGVKQSGRLQAAIVSIVMTVLVLFVIAGLGSIDTANYQPFMPEGIRGLIAATGLVFVSYAGVTKVASLAEEVKRPARNIPRAIFMSLVLMMFLYPAIVFVIVGVTPGADLSKDVTPMATAAAEFLGRGAELAIAGVAVLALVSMANAGILASSRYPFAMSRNRLAPSMLGRVGARSTPISAVLLTGGVLLTLIAVFPIIELAKLASAFQLLVFGLVNLSVIAFRESHVDWYRPSFRSPFYPWLQVAGIAASLFLLAFMGLVPMVGAIVIVLGGVAWYRIFGRSRTSHESASLDALRIRAMGRLVVDTRAAIESEGKASVLIPVHVGINDRRLRDLIRTAGRVIRQGGEVRVVQVARDGPDTAMRRARSTDEQEFDALAGEQAMELGVPISVFHATGRHRRQALASFVQDQGIDLVLAELLRTSTGRGFRSDMEWLGDRVLCDVALLGNRYIEVVDDIVVLGSGGPLDPVKLNLAGRIGQGEGSTVRIVHVVAPGASGRQVVSLHEYHDQLGESLPVPVLSEVERGTNLVAKLVVQARGADLVIIGAVRTRLRLLSDLVDRIQEQVDAPLLLVRTHELANRPSLRGRMLERVLRA